MKTEDFLEMLNGIDDSYIYEAGEDLENYRYRTGNTYYIEDKRNFSWKRVFAAVVCAAAVMVGVIFIVKNVRDIPIIENSSGVILGNDSTGVSSGTTNTSAGEAQIFPQKCSIHKQKARFFTEEQLLALFDEPPKRTDKSSDDYSCIEYTSETHTGCLINNRTLKFYSKTGSYYSIVCDYLYRNTNNEEYISKDDSLDFASREKVLEDLRSQLNNQFGISPDEWLVKDYFAVKKEGIDFYHSAEAAANSGDGSDAVHDIPIEDFYSINIIFQINGIPIYTGKSLDYGTTKIHESAASVIVSKNGIESICLYNLYETDMSAEGSMELTLISPEVAKELIQEKFSGFHPEEKGEVYDMQLIYLPIPLNASDKNCESFIAKPHYALYWKKTRNNNGATSISNLISYYDAVTGMDFITYQISS